MSDHDYCSSGASSSCWTCHVAEHEMKCKQCGRVIPVGGAYFIKGFSSTEIFCTGCIIVLLNKAAEEELKSDIAFDDQRIQCAASGNLSLWTYCNKDNVSCIKGNCPEMR